jgi:hypothetical protein
LPVESLGIAPDTPDTAATRANARTLHSNTEIGDLLDRSVLVDAVLAQIL